MKRVDLLEKMRIVAPALASNDIIPVNTHFWFTGKTLMAYNGNIAISTPCETDFRCAIPGMFLLNLIKLAGAKAIEFHGSGDAIVVTGAAMKVKMPTIPSSSCTFKMPEPPTNSMGKDGEVFANAIEVCLRSVALDTPVPDYSGVSLLPRNYGVDFYGASGLTLTRSIVRLQSGPWEKWRRAILPYAFAKQLPIMAKGKKFKFDLSFEKGRERAMFSDGETIMYGQLVETEKPLPFLTVFEKHIAAGTEFVPLASRLARVLDRACIVAKNEDGIVRTTIEVRKGVAKFTTQSRLGEIKDEMKVPEGQPDVTLQVDAKPVRDGCNDFDQMYITNDCFVMAGGEGRNGAPANYYLISGRAE